MRKTWEHLAAITDRLTSVLFNDDIKSFGGIGERDYATINIPGGGGTPIYNRRGCSSEILNLTPKWDQSGRGLSKYP